MFKEVSNYEGYYEVSDTGLVISKDRKVGNRVVRSKEMALVDNGTGYFQVTLNKNSKRKKFYIHRLVFETFIGEIPKGFEIDHIDNIKSNNALENLRCISKKENMADMLINNPHILFNLKNNIGG